MVTKQETGFIESGMHLQTHRGETAEAVAIPINVCPKTNGEGEQTAFTFGIIVDGTQTLRVVVNILVTVIPPAVLVMLLVDAILVQAWALTSSGWTRKQISINVRPGIVMVFFMVYSLGCAD